MYTPDKPDLWKAYQFCAERQLVFHLQQEHTGMELSQLNFMRNLGSIYIRNTMILTISF